MTTAPAPPLPIRAPRDGGAPEVPLPGPDLRQRLRRAAAHHGPVLATYGVLKLAGFAVFMFLLDSAGDFRKKNPRFGGGEHVWDVLGSWDGWWYQQVALHGYDPALEPVPGATGLITLQGNSAAFFPLYPALMRLVSECTGLGPYGAGITVSVLASFVAALGVYAVTDRSPAADPGWQPSGCGRCGPAPARSGRCTPSPSTPPWPPGPVTPS
ncbi:hypothetical protein GCM10027072_22750 [Streptomyces bullii]